ncbi:glucose dehydrogenase [Pseudomonas sp. EpS/L25]|nr:glucose dehydrogenase [Pseudomonas sp. EpS/L25]
MRVAKADAWGRPQSLRKASRYWAWLAVLGALLGASLALAAPAYRIETVASGLQRPWSLAFLPDGRALLTEGVGRLRVLVPDGRGRLGLQTEAVSGLPELYSEGQAGLFEVLPDPDFATNRLLYLSYAAGTRQANHLKVMRARLDGTRLQEVRTLFTSQPAKAFGQHFGARMALLGDGTLAIALGDGNVERTDAQRLDTHLGKIVRITRDGGVPPDNPFVNRPGALPEIYSLGHRNPQGLVWVAERQALYEHEHGSKGGDELNLIRAGANYGWPLTTGGVDYTGARISPFRELPGIAPPLLEWTPSIAPAGLTWYDGAGFPAWRGSLFVAALREKAVRRVPLVNGVPGEQELLFQELDQRLRDVRSGPDGTLWLLTDGEEGQVLRVVPG